MRGHVEGLESAHPIGAMLPGIYQGDDFAQRFTAGLDDVIAPVFSTLDNLAAYFDPYTAPDDFVEFLSLWVGIEFEASWSMQRRRDVIAHAVDLHRRRGTVRGIREAVALVTNAAVEVRENGGSAWAQAPGADLPGDPTPRLVVRIAAEDLPDLERRRIDALVSAVKPAHVPHTIELGPVEVEQEHSDAEAPAAASGENDEPETTGASDEIAEPDASLADDEDGAGED